MQKMSDENLKSKVKHFFNLQRKNWLEYIYMQIQILEVLWGDNLYAE